MTKIRAHTQHPRRNRLFKFHPPTNRRHPKRTRNRFDLETKVGELERAVENRFYICHRQSRYPADTK